MSAPRVAPGALRDIGPVNWVIARGAQVAMGTAQPPHIFTTLGRHRGLLRGWLMFAGRLMPGGKLPRRTTELVILRVAHVRGCEYEWHHHTKLARRAGVTRDEIEAVKAGPGAGTWSPREQAILAAADELLATGDLSDEAWDGLTTHLPERERIELVMLVAHYGMLASVIAALRIETDEPR